MLVIVIWREKWRGASTHNQLACLPSATAGANYRRQQGSLNSPFPVSPRGKAGAGGFPPRRWHAVRQQKAPAHIDAAAPPARGVSKRSAETPLAHPPDGYHRGRVVMVGLDLRHREKKFKDGRHVGLDFYDLLIEVAE